MNKNIKPLKLIILLIIVYTFIVLVSGVVEIQQFISEIPLSFYLVSLSFPLFSHLILSIRWHILVRYLGINIPFYENIKIYFSGLALIAAPARAGEAVRSLWLFNKFKIPLKIGIGITLAERIGDLLSAVLIIMWSLYSNIAYPILASAGLLILYYLTKYFRLFNRVSCNLKKIKSINYIFANSSLSKKVYSIYSTVKDLTKPIPCFLSTFICGVSWIIESIFLCLTFQQFGFYLDLGQSVLIRTGMGLGGVISFLPGGLIASEVTGIAIAISLGVSRAEAVSATLLVRFYTLFIPFLFGLMTYSFSRDLRDKS